MPAGTSAAATAAGSGGAQRAIRIELDPGSSRLVCTSLPATAGAAAAEVIDTGSIEVEALLLRAMRSAARDRLEQLRCAEARRRSCRRLGAVPARQLQRVAASFARAQELRLAREPLELSLVAPPGAEPRLDASAVPAGGGCAAQLLASISVDNRSGAVLLQPKIAAAPGVIAVRPSPVPAGAVGSAAASVRDALQRLWREASLQRLAAAAVVSGWQLVTGGAGLFAANAAAAEQGASAPAHLAGTTAVRRAPVTRRSPLVAGWPLPDAVLRSAHASHPLLLCVTFDATAQSPAQQLSCAFASAAHPPSAHAWKFAADIVTSASSSSPLVGLLLAAASEARVRSA